MMVPFKIVKPNNVTVEGCFIKALRSERKGEIFTLTLDFEPSETAALPAPDKIADEYDPIGFTSDLSEKYCEEILGDWLKWALGFYMFIHKQTGFKQAFRDYMAHYHKIYDRDYFDICLKATIKNAEMHALFKTLQETNKKRTGDWFLFIKRQ